MQIFVFDILSAIHRYTDIYVSEASCPSQYANNDTIRTVLHGASQITRLHNVSRTDRHTDNLQSGKKKIQSSLTAATINI